MLALRGRGLHPIRRSAASATSFTRPNHHHRNLDRRRRRELTRGERHVDPGGSGEVRAAIWMRGERVAVFVDHPGQQVEEHSRLLEGQVEPHARLMPERQPHDDRQGSHPPAKAPSLGRLGPMPRPRWWRAPGSETTTLVSLSLGCSRVSFAPSRSVSRDAVPLPIAISSTRCSWAAAPAEQSTHGDRLRSFYLKYDFELLAFRDPLGPGYRTDRVEKRGALRVWWLH